MLAKPPSLNGEKKLNSPEYAVRGEREPRLEEQGDDACPVEQVVHLPLHLHVVEADMVDDEGESVQQGEEEECVRTPAVEDLELLVGNTGEEGDPVGLACGCTVVGPGSQQLSDMEYLLH